MNSFDSSSRPALTAISSMATRQLLAELARVNVESGGTPVALESVGGVDAAKRVAAGEMFDLVFLASDALAKLVAGGHVLADSRVDLVRSQVALAVKSGLTVPAITTAADVRSAVLNAASIGYSTGPSGTALLALFERWGITAEIKSKLRQAPADNVTEDRIGYRGWLPCTEVAVETTMYRVIVTALVMRLVR